MTDHPAMSTDSGQMTAAEASAEAKALVVAFEDATSALVDNDHRAGYVDAAVLTEKTLLAYIARLEAPPPEVGARHEAGELVEIAKLREALKQIRALTFPPSLDKKGAALVRIRMTATAALGDLHENTY